MANEESGSEQKPASSGKLLGILKIVFAITNLLVVGGGAALVYMSTIGHETKALTDEDVLATLEKERKAEGKVSKPVVFTMEKFTVNLDGLPSRVVQAELNLEMLDEDGFEEVVSLGAQARDSIVKILNSKRFSDIETIQGKLFLKDQIRTSLNQFLKRGIVKDVYFSQFVVQ